MNRGIAALGLWMLVGAIFALSSSGRLDIIDAQFKFDASKSLVEDQALVLHDPLLIALNRGSADAPYPPATAVLSAPAVWAGLKFGAGNDELARFLWTLTRAFVGALVAPTLFLAWLALGVPPRSAAIWSGVACCATLVWPVAASSFDQADRGWFLLAGTVLAYFAVEKRSAALAVLSGLAIGLLVHYQRGMVLVLPVLLLGSVDFSERSWTGRFKYSACFALGLVPPALGLLLFYGNQSQGSGLSSPSMGFDWRNIALGALALTISPGKGILIYSPAVLLALLGLKDLWGKSRRLVFLIGGSALLYFLVIAGVGCPGGDWSWGPRYLVVVLPLLCLGLPFCMPRMKTPWVVTLIVLSTAIQCLALSRDHQTFFFDRNLEPAFWKDNTVFYFRNSQLAARFHELMDPSAPKNFARFSSTPDGSLTYAPLGPPAAMVSLSSEWVKQFAVFYWPRPWPLWMGRISNESQFFAWRTLVAALFAMGVSGLLWTVISSRKYRNLSRLGKL